MAPSGFQSILQILAAQANKLGEIHISTSASVHGKVLDWALMKLDMAKYPSFPRPKAPGKVRTSDGESDPQVTCTFRLR